MWKIEEDVNGLQLGFFKHVKTHEKQISLLWRFGHFGSNLLGNVTFQKSNYKIWKKIEQNRHAMVTLTFANMPLADCSVLFLPMYPPCDKFVLRTPCPYHPIVLQYFKNWGEWGWLNLMFLILPACASGSVNYHLKDSHRTICSLPFFRKQSWWRNFY